MSELLMEKAAISFRAEQGFNTREAIGLKSLLQKINVISFFSPLSDQFSGMAIKTGKSGHESRFMLINTQQSIGKQHFTICHELYHLYRQQNFSSRVCKTGLFDKKLDKEEYNADLFASFLLLPTDGLLELIPNAELAGKAKISLATIIYIEQYYSCSRRALLYRLRKMDLITPDQYELFSVNIKRSAIESGFNTDIYEPGNFNVVIGNYGTLAKELFDTEKVSQSHYYALLKDLGINMTDIEQISNGEA